MTQAELGKAAAVSQRMVAYHESETLLDAGITE
jgi:hypothetical protein